MVDRLTLWLVAGVVVSVALIAVGFRAWAIYVAERVRGDWTL